MHSEGVSAKLKCSLTFKILDFAWVAVNESTFGGKESSRDAEREGLLFSLNLSRWRIFRQIASLSFIELMLFPLEISSVLFHILRTPMPSLLRLILPCSRI